MEPEGMALRKNEARSACAGVEDIPGLLGLREAVTDRRREPATNGVAFRSNFSLRRLMTIFAAGTETTAASRLDHIIMIAGPSGSGKSTIMGEFVEDRLPKNISAHLPAEAKRWTRTTGNDLTRKGLSEVLRIKGKTPGFVVHYDIMRAYTRGFDDYSNDPAVQAVVGNGAALTVLTVLPSREMLFEQFLERARRGEYDDWPDKPEVARRMKRKLRARLFRLFGRTPKLLKEGQISLLSIYAFDQTFNQWTGRWEKFIEDIRRNRDDVRLVYVAPDVAAGDHPRFRLLRSV